MTNQSDVSRFARAELERFLPSSEAAVECRIDPSLPAFSFAGENAAEGIVLRGADDTCVLHAVHTFLEQMGCRFEITGPVQLRGADLSAFTPFSITPAVQRRGIRQHINFPMDISSYTLEEAWNTSATWPGCATITSASTVIRTSGSTATRTGI